MITSTALSVMYIPWLSMEARRCRSPEARRCRSPTSVGRGLRYTAEAVSGLMADPRAEASCVCLHRPEPHFCSGGALEGLHPRLCLCRT